MKIRLLAVLVLLSVSVFGIMSLVKNAQAQVPVRDYYDDGISP